MAIGQRLTAFYEKTNPRQRERIAGIVASDAHWNAIQAAASSGHDAAAADSLKSLRRLFDERKTTSPAIAGVRLFQLGGILGPDLTAEFLGLLEAAA